MLNSAILFDLPPQEILNKLQIVSNQGQCLARLKTFIIQIQSNSLKVGKQQQKSETFFALIIKKDYLVQTNIEKTKILSILKFDYQVKFQILRSAQLSQNNNKRPIGIIFYFPQLLKKCPITLYFKNPLKTQLNFEEKFEQLEQFCQTLSEKFIIQKGFHENFKAIRKIGKGVTASVFSAQRLTDKKKVAVKSFKKQEYFKLDNGKGKMAFLKEFKIMTQIRSRYLCKLFGVFQSQNSIYIVIELLDRTLYKYIQKFNFPQPQLCKKILFKLLIGLKYLHEKKIMHRDLKLENIMIRGQAKDDVQPVIIDFGLAEHVQDKQFTYIRCGTPGYAAPQIINISNNDIQTRYNQACDIFSLGVVFHILILGKPVFDGSDMKSVIHKNRKCQIDYEFNNFPGLVAEAKNLLRIMLQKDPSQRGNLNQIINHSFFQKERQLFKKELEQFQSIDQKQLKIAQKDQEKNS